MGVRCMKGLITIIRIRIRSKSRIKPQSAMTTGGVPGTAMTTGGVPRQLANRDNQPAVAGLLGWAMVCQA